METFEWMLHQAAIPLVIGFAMAFTTSKWSRWSARKKVRAAYWYQILLLVGSFAEAFDLHAWLGNIAVQLRSGVFVAFGIGFNIAQWRFGTSWQQRVGVVLCLLLFAVVLRMRFESEFVRAFDRFAG
jgi:hypothetical protein